MEDDEERRKKNSANFHNSKMDKGAKDMLVRSPGENGGGQDAQK